MGAGLHGLEGFQLQVSAGALELKKWKKQCRRCDAAAHAILQSGSSYTPVRTELAQGAGASRGPKMAPKASAREAAAATSSEGGRGGHGPAGTI